MPRQPNSAPTTTLPLPALLSHALVAFTIELDNEFEHRAPHRTTRFSEGQTRSDPWLTSLAMWFNCMQFLQEEGLSVAQLQEAARTRTNLHGMQRWGYVTITPGTADAPRKPPEAEWIVRPTQKGRRAQQLWRPLIGEIEERWAVRFGDEALKELRAALQALTGLFPLALPDCLPLVGYGLLSRRSPAEFTSRDQASPASEFADSLPALLARALLAFALEFEEGCAISLAICANILRNIEDAGTPVKELARRGGISQEIVAVATHWLQRHDYALIRMAASGGEVKGNVKGNVKAVTLTSKGQAAREGYARRVGNIEASWRARFGEGTVDNVVRALEQIVGDSSDSSSLLFGGLQPYPDGWRAKEPRPQCLPHFPLVTHRGGYPDGS